MLRRQIVFSPAEKIFPKSDPSYLPRRTTRRETVDGIRMTVGIWTDPESITARVVAAELPHYWCGQEMSPVSERAIERACERALDGL